jgi:hypothetical protein
LAVKKPDSPVFALCQRVFRGLRAFDGINAEPFPFLYGIYGAFT